MIETLFRVTQLLPHIWHLFVFFFNAPATTEFYPLSLHDALPIWACSDSAVPPWSRYCVQLARPVGSASRRSRRRDRKSTRLNSSHVAISYAVFCLKKKKKPNG